MSLGTAEQPAAIGSGERRSRAPFHLESTAAGTDRIISMKAAMAITGWSRTSIYRLVDEDKFPKPVKMGECRVGFVERELREYMAAKLRGREVPPGSAAHAGA
jgi:prophage regulatory protein